MAKRKTATTVTPAQRSFDFLMSSPPVMPTNPAPLIEPHPMPVGFLPKPHHYRLAFSFGMDAAWVDDLFARDAAWAHSEGLRMANWDAWFEFAIRDVFHDGPEYIAKARSLMG